MSGSVYTFTPQNFGKRTPHAHLWNMNEAVRVRIQRGEPIAQACDRVEALYHPELSYTVEALIKE